MTNHVFTTELWKSVMEYMKHLLSVISHTASRFGILRMRFLSGGIVLSDEMSGQSNCDPLTRRTLWNLL